MPFLKVWSITAGPDGALWFTTEGSQIIGRITTGGVITTYPVPALIFPTSITSGPDGALWFIGLYKIGRVATNGSVTIFPASPGGTLWDIATGPDGALWVAKDGGIARMTTNGTLSVYNFPLGPHGEQISATAITTGPDGALWFTKTGGPSPNSVGRITTAGVITDYPVPSAFTSDPGGITAGKDGSLWITEGHNPAASPPGWGRKILRLTLAGNATEYVTPTSDSAPGAITAGPDGALWFTEFNTRKIGRLTIDGVFTEYSPVSSASMGLASGPDGAVWFAELGSKVGRISACEYSIGAASTTFGVTGGGGDVAVTTGTGCPWNATSNASWITVASNSGSGASLVHYSVAPNAGNDQRTGTISVAGSILTVVEAGLATCTYSVNPTSYVFPLAGGSFAVNVTAPAGCPWTVSNSVPWISSSAGGTGGGSLTLFASANGGDYRSESITVAGRSVSVGQAGSACGNAIDVSDKVQVVQQPFLSTTYYGTYGQVTPTFFRELLLKTIGGQTIQEPVSLVFDGLPRNDLAQCNGTCELFFAWGASISITHCGSAAGSYFPAQN